jgi:4-hydroxybenzoate polyprenyltransferase
VTILAAYVRERLPVRLFGPVIAAHAAAALVARATAPDLTEVAVAVLGSALLIVQFRIWDDLEDRDLDRRTHPNRVTVRHDAGPFRRAAVSLAVVTLLLLSARMAWAAILALIALYLAFWAAYRVRPALSTAVWRYPILLSKYPAFVVVMALTLGSTSVALLALAAAVVYVGACAYEAVHERPFHRGATP